MRKPAMSETRSQPLVRRRLEPGWKSVASKTKPVESKRRPPAWQRKPLVSSRQPLDPVGVPVFTAPTPGARGTETTQTHRGTRRRKVRRPDQGGDKAQTPRGWLVQDARHRARARKQAATEAGASRTLSLMNLRSCKHGSASGARKSYGLEWPNGARRESLPAGTACRASARARRLRLRLRVRKHRQFWRRCTRWFGAARSRCGRRGRRQPGE
jgi:hypothetical protein